MGWASYVYTCGGYWNEKERHDARLGIRNQESGIRNQESGIRNQESGDGAGHPERSEGSRRSGGQRSFAAAQDESPR